MKFKMVIQIGQIVSNNFGFNLQKSLNKLHKSAFSGLKAPTRRHLVSLPMTNPVIKFQNSRFNMTNENILSQFTSLSFIETASKLLLRIRYFCYKIIIKWWIPYSCHMFHFSTIITQKLSKLLDNYS